MFAAGVVIASAAAAQALAAHAVGSAWWVPQLALIALIRRMTHTPRAWLPLSVIAAAALIVWSIRGSGAIVVSLIAIGGAWRAAMWYWDVADARLQAVAAGISAAVLVGVTAAFDHAVSWPIIALIAWQAVWTAVAAIAWDRLPAGRQAARPERV